MQRREAKFKEKIWMPHHVRRNCVGGLAGKPRNLGEKPAEAKESQDAREERSELDQAAVLKKFCVSHSIRKIPKEQPEG